MTTLCWYHLNDFFSLTLDSGKRPGRGLIKVKAGFEEKECTKWRRTKPFDEGNLASIQIIIRES